MLKSGANMSCVGNVSAQLNDFPWADVDPDIWNSWIQVIFPSVRKIAGDQERRHSKDL